MSCKYIDPLRWQQPDFNKLTPNAKLLICYLYDNCDLAGFIPKNLNLFSFFLGISIKDIELSIKEIKNLIAINNDIVWLKNHLIENRNFPLNPKNQAHKSIINSFERNKFHTEAYKFFSSLRLHDNTLPDKDKTLHYNTEDLRTPLKGPSNNKNDGLEKGELLRMFKNDRS